MHRILTTGMGGIVLAILVTGGGLAADKAATTPAEEAFLSKAAGGQQAEIALGRMAAQQAESKKVKQFGERMVQDHEKASQEIKQLAEQEQITLHAEMPPMTKDKAQQFSKLSGKAFDLAYINHMMKDHVKDVTEFEEGAKELHAPRVQQWASATLPVLKEHLRMAQHIAGDLRIDSKRP
jgi:putative membrane protein